MQWLLLIASAADVPAEFRKKVQQKGNTFILTFKMNFIIFKIQHKANLSRW